MQTNQTIVYLDDLTTIEHLQPILRELAQLGECQFWVSSAVNRGDERFTWFAAEAPGSISTVWPWERTLDRFMRRLLKRLFRASPKFRDDSVALVSRVWRRPGELGKATRYICGWGDPSTFMFHVALSHGVSCIQIPHGFNIFRETLLTDAAVAGEWRGLSFSDRNLFDLIIVQSPNLASWLQDFGVSQHKIRVLGSPRFSEEWSSALDTRVHQARRPDIDVLFLLPNWNYRVQWEDLKAVVQLLAEASLSVVIGMHPRVPKSEGEGVEFLNELKHLDVDGLEISTEPAYRLIPFSKLVLASGTSVGLHALSTGRPFLNLAFLTANRTIYDFVDGINVLSLDELKGVLDVLAADNYRTMPDLSELDEFLNRYIRLDKSFEQLVGSYISAIRNVQK